MEEVMMRGLLLLVLGLRLVMRELVLPVLALAMVCIGTRWEGCGSGAGEAAGCCAASIQSAGIPSPSHVVMRAPVMAQGGALVLGMGLSTTTPKGADGWPRLAAGSQLEREGEPLALPGKLEVMTVKQLRDLARLCGMRELARKGRKADLLEALEA
jgi:hypothetical protein